MIVIFKKACVFNGIPRKVGMITKLNQDKAEETIKAGLVEQYFGEFPPKKKVNFNLKDLK